MSRIVINGILSGSLSQTNTLNGEVNSTTTLQGDLSVPRSIPGTNDYERMINKPSIESVELIGNKTFEDLGLESIDNAKLMELLTL